MKHNDERPRFAPISFDPITLAIYLVGIGVCLLLALDTGATAFSKSTDSSGFATSD